jgi:hypothetical protein
MGSTPEGAGGEAPPLASRPHDRAADLEDLVFTLDICRRALPWDAHPEHFDRLRRIEGMVRWSLEQGEGKARQRRQEGERGAEGGSGVG